MSAPAEAFVPVSAIRPSPHQARRTFDPDALAALSDDIAAQGLLQPIGVRGPMDHGDFELVWGHRRWLAVQLLGWKKIEARVFEADYDPRIAAASENLQREQLTPLEESHLVMGLLGTGLTPKQVAHRVRRTLAWVEGRQQLAAAPEDIQRAVHDRVIPLGVAYALMAIDHAGYRRDLIEQARRLGATVAVAQVWVAEYARDRAQLIRSHEGVAEIIRRAATIQATTTCGACQQPVAWVQVETLRLCPPCYQGIQAELLAGEGS